ncbi:MAG TPA: hypothetical protein VMZ53_32155 [Kofleriaceae bacterium]|nr:hypothetical protein [Kofleriaceae bacterium]
MSRVLTLAAVLAVAACGRLGFDFAGGGGSSTSPDATGVPDDTGVLAAACPEKPMTSGIMVKTGTELVNAIASASPGDTILLADGLYSTASTISIDTPNLTIRSASNHSDGPVVDGLGLANPLFYVRAKNVSFISLTMRNTKQDAVFVEPLDAAGDATGVRIYDVTFTDVRGPAVRAKSYMSLATTPFADDGEVACSRVGHTVDSDCGPDGVFGVRLQGARNWTIRDTYFSGRCSPSRTRAVWADAGARDVTVTNNVFANNRNNILFGGIALRTYPDALPAGCSGTPHLWGGLVCNNRIGGLGVSSSTGNDFEEGIALWTTCDTWVLHNTVVSPAGAETYENIEYRFAGTYVHLVNNLLSVDPLLRDSGQLDPASTNTLYTSPSDFVDAAAGDLRISTSATIASGVAISQCLTDANGKPRNTASPTPGAFER